MMKKFLVSILIITFVIQSIFSNDMTCPSIKCGELAEGNCSKKAETPQKTIEFTFQACTDKDKNFCNYRTGVDVACEQASDNTTGYPGTVCEKTEDCVAGTTCTDKKCKGVEDDKECNEGEHHKCNIGRACIKKTADNKFYCSSQLKENDTCASNWECANNLSCNTTTNKCQKLFSIGNNQSASVTGFEDLNVSFCQSGFLVNGVCRSLKLKSSLIDTPCNTDSDCKYEYDDTKTEVEFLNDEVNATQTVEIEDSCLCSFNSKAEKYCRKTNVREAGDQTKYTSYIESIQNLLSAENCHSKERFNCRNTKLARRGLFILNENNKADVLFDQKLKGADSCVKSIIYPFYSLGSCPVVQYIGDAQEDNNCVDAKGYLVDNRKIDIFSCKENFTCPYTANKFVTNEDFVNECIEIKPSELPYALPGETCSKKENCIQVFTYDGETEVKTQECTEESLCKGAALDERCKNNDSCVAGNYCDTTDADPKKHTCKAQKEEDDECKQLWECKNNLICNGTKCVSPFSETQGTDVSKYEATSINLACETGIEHKGKCAKEFYDKEKHTVESGLVKCDYGSKCSYEYFYDEEGKDKDTLEKDCVCGYNKEAQGYCDYARHDEGNVKRFTSVDDLVKTNLNNNNHTAHRNSGFTDKETSPACYPYFINSRYAGAESDIIQVLGFGECKDIDPEDPSSSSEDPSSSSEDPSDPSDTSSGEFMRLAYVLVLTIMFILA